jgi:hypothetical protein
MPDFEEHEWLDDDAARAITYHADIDPLVEGETWAVQLSVNGVLESYALKPDRTPHMWHRDELVCNGTFLLSSTGAPFVTQKSRKQLDQCLYKQECLEAIASEYGNFDKRCMWKCVRQPDGAGCPSSHDALRQDQVQALWSQRKSEVPGCAHGTKVCQKS